MEHIVRRTLKFLLLALILGLAVAFLSYIGDLVKLVIISAIIAYLLDPLVSWIESYGMTRTPATALLYLVLTLIIGAIMIMLLPVIGREIEAISAGIDPEKTQLLVSRLDAFIQQGLAFVGIKEFNLTARLAQEVVSFGNQLFTNLLQVVSIFTNLILTPFIVFFLLKDGRDIKKQLISITPNRYFELVCNLYYKMDVQIGNYLRGQILDALIIGILSTFALWMLDVKYFVVIGTLAGLANLIPYIGPLSGALMAMIITFMDSGEFSTLLYIALAFGLVQLIDNVVVQPAIVARTVNLPPLAVLLVVIIGVKFFGVLGMLLSIPLTAVIKVTFTEGVKLYRQFQFD